MDVWDGSHAQVDISFRQGTGTTYPLLLKGSKVGTLYRLYTSDYIVIDHLGIIQYRPATFGSSATAVREAVAQSLEALPTAAPTTVADLPLPNAFDLQTNYPNPFNASTFIRFTLPTSDQVSLRLFDINGRHLHTLLERVMPAGAHAIHWDGRDHQGKAVASGVYLYRLHTGKQKITRKMTLLR